MMSFILLGKHSDDRVVVVSEALYESRKAATDALSELTADPSFPHWDAEVFVVDVEKATPVLLVRPTPVPQEDIGRLESVPQAPADTAFTYAGPESGDADESTESLVVEDDAVAEAEDEGEAGAGDADLTAALSELGLGEELTAEEEPAAETEPASATTEAPEEPASEGDDGEGGALRDAIARTTAQMAAAGIVPPESVGPGEGTDDEAEEEPVPDSEEFAEVTTESEEPMSAEGAGEAPWPWAAAGEEAGGDAEGFTLSPLEEPGVDEGSLVKAAGDDETFESARPVILGDYDDVPAAEPMSVSESPISEGASDDLAAALAAAVAEAGVAGGDDADDVVAEPGDAPEAGDDAEVAKKGDELSCDDCIYFQTCPNKGDREPSSCGSFQWK